MMNIEITEQQLKLALKELNCQLEKDLNFSVAFHNAFNKEVTDYTVYNNLKNVGFKAFLTDFSVARSLNADENKREEVIRLLIDGINRKQKVKETAEDIQKSERRLTTNGALPLSMVSKVYFLHSPHKYIPYDSYAFATLKSLKADVVEKDYEKYLKAIKDVKGSIKSLDEIIKKVNLSEYEQQLSILKKRLGDEFTQEKFIENRITDKLLWIIGKDL